jgi:hypothetical protein
LGGCNWDGSLRPAHAKTHLQNNQKKNGLPALQVGSLEFKPQAHQKKKKRKKKETQYYLDKFIKGSVKTSP